MLDEVLDVAGWVANCLAGPCINEIVPVEVHRASGAVLFQPFPVIPRHHFGVLSPLFLEGASRAIRPKLGVPEIQEVTSALLTVKGFSWHG